MNYCSNCGSGDMEFKIPLNDHLPRYFCQKCETIHYTNPNIVVGAIPIWEGKVLLAKRNIEPRKGYWNLPCGFLELNETVEDGAIREVFEETKVDVKLNHLHTIYNLPDAHQVYMIFHADMLHSGFKTTPESSEIQLFDLNDIPWNVLAFHSNSFALKRFIDDQNIGFKNVHLGTFKISK